MTANNLEARATLGNRLESGEWHEQTIPERTTVRHGIGNDIELGRAANSFDNQNYPNYPNVLAFRLWWSTRLIGDRT